MSGKCPFLWQQLYDRDNLHYLQIRVFSDSLKVLQIMCRQFLDMKPMFNAYVSV